MLRAPVFDETVHHRREMLSHHYALTTPLFLLLRQKVDLHYDIVWSIFPWSYQLEINIAIADLYSVWNI